MNKKVNVFFPFVVAVFFGLGIYLGAKINFESATNTSGNKIINLPAIGGNKLNDIINYIDQEYVDEVKKDALIDQAITTILQELDPHSYYISAAELKALSEPLEGSFEGIGVQFSIQKDTVVVISPVVGGPSEKVGVMAGDRIIKVNKELIAGNGVTNRKVMGLLKGEKGTEVNIEVFRNNQDTIDFKIIRDKIPIYSLDVAYMVNPQTGYIKLSRFSKNTYQEFIEAGQRLQEAGMQKLILDLRGNGGGFMDAAINIADEFLAENTLIVYTEGRSRPKHKYLATTKSTFLNTELAVLIDESSASASEIIAGAIQDNDRGLIIGRRSFGKGLVQEQSSWRDGSATRLTIARYYTPSGRCIQKPYDNGISDYNHDYTERLENGELYNEENIQQIDSLKYFTTNGRPVFGGGGIMPDEFIPIDTVGASYYLSELIYKGVFYQFAFEYADKHRDELNKLNGHQNFVTYFENHQLKIINEFMAYAEQSGVNKNQEQFTKSKDRITQRLRAQIARNIWDDSAFYPLWNEHDSAINRALNLLQNPTTALLSPK